MGVNPGLTNIHCENVTERSGRQTWFFPHRNDCVFPESIPFPLQYEHNYRNIIRPVRLLLDTDSSL